MDARTCSTWESYDMPDLLRIRPSIWAGFALGGWIGANRWGPPSLRTARADWQPWVAEHPESDFLLSREVVEKLDQDTSHEIRRITPELVLLYSKTRLPSVTPRWSCAM